MVEAVETLQMKKGGGGYYRNITGENITHINCQFLKLPNQFGQQGQLSNLLMTPPPHLY